MGYLYGNSRRTRAAMVREAYGTLRLGGEQYRL